MNLIKTISIFLLLAGVTACDLESGNSNTLFGESQASDSGPESSISDEQKTPVILVSTTRLKGQDMGPKP